MTYLIEYSATHGGEEEGLCHEREICPSVITYDEFYHSGHAGTGGALSRLAGIVISGRQQAMGRVSRQADKQGGKRVG